MQISKFTKENLAKALANAYTSPVVVSSKNHFRYLINYLGDDGLQAKSILIEDNYISKDFLHDYAAYYALCFEPYSKFCKRVHFFGNEFTVSEFQSIILGDEIKNKDFWNHYLGFVVVKPIPVKIIGYSVLKTYSNGNDYNNRNFWGLRKYKIHIYGNVIELESLAFQEQDSVLAACATTAIWAMLNKASVDFHTILKSPSQITRDADNVSPDGSRLFPNKGLNLLQICQAILNSGLVSEIKQDNYELKDNKGVTIKKIVSNQYLKKIINAYSPIGIPIILVIEVPSGGSYGLHAITISGFIQKNTSPFVQSSEINWLSDSIEKFYAHDDQWGPFARIEFNSLAELITPWSKSSATNSPTFARSIVVPVYPKIRISYEDIEVIVLGLNTILSLMFDKKIVSVLVWDIKINFSENVKSSIKLSSLGDSEKIKRLNKSLPKYIWVASCFINENKIFDFTFDATNVESGMIGKDFICYLTSDIKPTISDFLSKNRVLLEPLFIHSSKSLYYDFLIEELNS